LTSTSSKQANEPKRERLISRTTTTRKEKTMKASEIWQGEGWYSISYSDGGQDWTSDGAIWIESKQQLEDELAAAREDETDTHLAYCEYLGDNDEPNEVE